MPTESPRIHVIGSLNIDYTTVTARFPGPGETISAKSLQISAGGKGANQAIACGRAGHIHKYEADCWVSLFGAVGVGDAQYQNILEPVLDSASVNVDGLRKLEDVQTGTATIIIDESEGGENRILVVPGANHEGMQVQDLNLDKAVKMHAGCAELFVFQGEIPAETTFALLRTINKSAEKDKLMEVLWNPAPAYEQSIPPDIWKCITILIVNETEMGQLIPGARKLYVDATSDDEKMAALRHAADWIHEKKIRNLVVTRGAEGLFCSGPKGCFSIPAINISKVVDTTCAGDTFVGYLTVDLARYMKKNQALADKEVMERACRRATLAAAKCVSKAGAIDSIPWGWEI
jgi:ribokinase